ncbi:MAG: hypothetical protein HQM08_26455 [Candidatus Riflebacteria bacterium]|nr:hypothetical protein [Candidatus Riflebacteria bacterium]
MITIELIPEDASVLKGVLADCVSDLRMEIADTDEMAYREELKKVKEVLKKVIQMIPVESPQELDKSAG